MASQPRIGVERRKHDPDVEKHFRDGANKPVPKGVSRSLGLGLITGASDDDPSAIGTYAQAGAQFEPSFLWTAPVTFPVMFAVVYLCSKLGQVAGQGLFAVIRQHYARPILFFFLVTAVVGNIIEAGADISGMAAALNLLVPIPISLVVMCPIYNGLACPRKPSPAWQAKLHANPFLLRNRCDIVFLQPLS